MSSSGRAERRYRAAAMLAVFLTTACSTASPDRLPTIVESSSPAIGGTGALEQAVGLETLGGVLTPLLQPGCRLPCERKEVFSTAADGQEQISIRLFRGSGTTTADAIALGEYRIEGIPPMPRGHPQVEVRLAAEGRDLIIEASDVESRRPYRVVRVRASNDAVDATVDFLLTAAAADFHAHQSSAVRVRAVRMGHVTTAGEAPQYMLCGEFQAAADGGTAGWTPFATIKTSGYEQWIGAQAVGYCQGPSIEWDNVDDLSSSLQSRLDALR